MLEFTHCKDDWAKAKFGIPFSFFVEAARCCPPLAAPFGLLKKDSDNPVTELEKNRLSPLSLGFLCFLLLNLLGCRQAVSAPVSARSSVLPAQGQGIHKIQHIVFLIKENRTFDQYFGTFPGADGATYGQTSDGKTAPLTRAPDVAPYDLGHSYRDAVLVWMAVVWVSLTS